MKWLLAPIVAICSFQASASFAAEAWLSMVYTNALHAEMPFSLFSKGKWSPDPKARFVKLHLYLDEPVLMKSMEIDDCGSNIDPDIAVFFNFDQRVVRFEPGMAENNSEYLSYPRREGGLLVVDGFEESLEARSITINFEKNSGFTICGITLKDPDGKPYKIRTAALVGGTVKSSSILAPLTAYDPIFLFDSRFEYGWASNKKAHDVSLDFKFDEVRRVEKIRIWNGYQRSVIHCTANSRARKIRITGDGGYSAEIEVADVLGSQVIALPKPFEGKNLRFHIVDSYAGKSYKDLVISELRFFDGGEWFLLDPSRQLKSAIAVNRADFAKVGAVALLNDSFGGREERTETIKATAEYAAFKVMLDMAVAIRLRADGSFYLSGSVDESYEQDAGDSHDFFALGNYAIKKVSAGGGIRLRLFGLYYESSSYSDCNGCGRDCNKTELPEGVTVQKIFQEYVTIKPAADGGFEVVNESGGKKLPFGKITAKRLGVPR